MTRNKFNPEQHLKQPRFTYSDCGKFTKHRKRITETVNLKHLHQRELDKSCFPQDTAYSDINNVAMRTISSKCFKKKAYKIIENTKSERDQTLLTIMVYKFFDKRSSISSEWK